MMSEKTSCIVGTRIENTGFHHTLSLISGKYRMAILYCLSEFGTVRFNEMKKFIHGITFKSLSSNLKILEEDGLVLRKDYGENPPRVEYSLSELGTTLIPILDAMCIWGEEHMDQKRETSVRMDHL